MFTIPLAFTRNGKNNSYILSFDTKGRRIQGSSKIIVYYIIDSIEYQILEYIPSVNTSYNITTTQWESVSETFSLENNINEIDLKIKITNNLNNNNPDEASMITNVKLRKTNINYNLLRNSYLLTDKALTNEYEGLLANVIDWNGKGGNLPRSHYNWGVPLIGTEVDNVSVFHGNFSNLGANFYNLQQTIDLTQPIIERQYELTFKIQGRLHPNQATPNTWGPNTTKVSYYINGNEINLDTITPTNGVFTSKSYSFNINSDIKYIEIKFYNTMTGSDKSNAISDVKLIETGTTNNLIENENFSDHSSYSGSYSNTTTITDWEGSFYHVEEGDTAWNYGNTNYDVISLQYGSHIKQTVEINLKTTYKLSFDIRGRPRSGTGPNTTKIIYSINGNEILIDKITPTITTWESKEYYFSLDSNIDTIEIKFENTLEGNLSNGISNVKLTEFGSTYNLITNGDFSDYTTYSGTFKNTTSIPGWTGKFYHIESGDTAWEYGNTKDIISLRGVTGSTGTDYNDGTIQQTIHLTPYYTYFKFTLQNYFWDASWGYNTNNWAKKYAIRYIRLLDKNGNTVPYTIESITTSEWESANNNTWKDSSKLNEDTFQSIISIGSQQDYDPTGNLHLEFTLKVDSNVKAKSYELFTRSYGWISNIPVKWKVEGSNDNITWKKVNEVDIQEIYNYVNTNYPSEKNRLVHTFTNYSTSGTYINVYDITGNDNKPIIARNKYEDGTTTIASESYLDTDDREITTSQHTTWATELGFKVYNNSDRISKAHHNWIANGCPLPGGSSNFTLSSDLEYKTKHNDFALQSSSAKNYFNIDPYIINNENDHQGTTEQNFTVSCKCSINTNTIGVIFEAGGTGQGLVLYCFDSKIYLQWGNGSSYGVSNQFEIEHQIPIDGYEDIFIEFSNKQYTYMKLIIDNKIIETKTYSGINAQGGNQMGINRKHNSIAVTKLNDINSGISDPFTIQNGTVNYAEVYLGYYIEI